MPKFVWVLALVCMLLLRPDGAHAQASRFFPETGYTVSGRFLEFWQSNGGLAVFGYPLGAQVVENGRDVQYFERQRFELHPELARPYDLLLGRLGAELLGQGAQPPAGSGTPAGCVLFAVTQHTVCNQQGSVGFLSYWRSHGLEFDGRRGTSEAESLALFGYPLTEAYEYTASTGETVLAQWFERARFEWHPNNADPYRVLLGRLGAELLNLPPATVNRVKLFFIALDDAGSSGKAVGCGDSVVPVDVVIPPTPAPLGAALSQLLANNDQYYGASGLYNALYQSDLRVDRVTIVAGRATVNLLGTLRLGGVCDSPRVQAQLEETVRQFSTVTAADIFINGVPLADALSER